MEKKIVNINDLNGLYSIDRTIKFDLKPIGKTLENIERKGIIANDEKLTEGFIHVKKLLDEYHKSFIKKCLSNCKLKTDSDDNYDSLEEYMAYVSKTNRDDKDDKMLDAIRNNLRNQIVKSFEKDDLYPDLFKKEMIQKHLPEWLRDEEDKKIVAKFKNFTTYFDAYNKNRKNMYSAEDKSTAIAHRLIHENLPMFIDNIRVFDKIAESSVSDNFSEIGETFKVNCVNDIFCLGHFTEVLSQESIDSYNYIIGEINKCVNLYNQKVERKERLPLLKSLYKIMLTDHAKLNWLPEKFTSDQEMIAAINEMHEALDDILTGGSDNSLRSLLQNIASYDTSKIYISNDKGLTDISQQLFGRYDVYTNSIKDEVRSKTSPTPKEKREPELYEKKINKLFNSTKSFRLAYLNSLVDSDKKVEDYFGQMGAYDRDGEQRINLFTQLEMAYISASDVLSGKHRNLNQSDEDIEVIKNLMDIYKSIQHFVKPLLGSGDEVEKDNVFYSSLCGVWDSLCIVTPLYNKVSQWLARKPYSTEKIKLNFGNPQLLGGWDVNKEKDYSGVLLIRNGKYYLAIMDKESKQSFATSLPSDGECYDKVVYKFFKDITTMVPKCSTQTKTVKQHFANSSEPYTLFDKKSFNAPVEITKEIFELNNVLYNGVKKFQIEYLRSTNDRDGYEHAVNQWKEFCMQFLRAYKSTAIYDLSSIEKDWAKYTDLSSFYNAVNLLLYNISYKKVSVDYINSLVDEGKLYLFEIWNRDFSECSRGKDQLHTLYWKSLFTEQNLADVIYKLNGEAEIFYRKKSLDIKNTTIHRAGKPIRNKNRNSRVKNRVLKYDIIKDRRYTCDSFKFHVPIKINFKSSDKVNINPYVLEIIRNGGIKHIIGIDRGERNLLYLSLIDLNGNIVKQMSLNKIVNIYNGEEYTMDYKELLNEREGERMEARKNWKTQQSIKDVKDGYLSQVIHIIAKMMVDYQAIVVLEDLTPGFKRTRRKIESQVYEKFEKALINKLNYYVDKEIAEDEIGGLRHGLQLTNNPKDFNNFVKQNGCLFYVSAWNTSNIDPVTGFVNMLHPIYENCDKARMFFSCFDSIRYNKEKDWFEFALDYTKFSKSKGNIKESRAKWTLCTYGTRIKTFRNHTKNNQWDNKEVNLTEEFKKLFSEAGIDISGNLKQNICESKDKKLLEPLMGLMKLLLQMRNSIANSDVDYILSPVADVNGHFFDSRESIKGLPDNADANGAYNIALKGLWDILQIKNADSKDKPNLAISNEEWLKFVQEKPYLQTSVSTF